MDQTRCGQWTRSSATSATSAVRNVKEYETCLYAILYVVVSVGVMFWLSYT